MNFKFLRTEKKGSREQVTFVGSEMKIYIPRSFFSKNEDLATVVGDKIETMGLFWFEVDRKFYELQLPVKMMFEFSEEERTTRKLKPELPSEEYNVFILKNGDAFLYNTQKKRDSDEVNFFVNKLIEGAKLPKTVPYKEVTPLFLSMLGVTRLNGGLGVPAVSIEFLLSEMFRTKTNMSKPYRMSYNGKTHGQYDYKMVRITKVPELTSAFTGLLGEDVNQQIVAAVTHSRSGRKQRQSPIQRVIKY